MIVSHVTSQFVDNLEYSFPKLSVLAKMFLSVPASQATCERSFSTSRRLCNFERSSLTPKHVERLTFMKQNANELYLYDTS
jgi:hypothetical protein